MGTALLQVDMALRQLVMAHRRRVVDMDLPQEGPQKGMDHRHPAMAHHLTEWIGQAPHRQRALPATDIARIEWLDYFGHASTNPIASTTLVHPYSTHHIHYFYYTH